MKPSLFKKYALLTTLLCGLLGGTMAQSNYVPSPENIKARESFRKDGFGMFIHWGLYSLMADGEWVMFHKQIPAKNYEKLAQSFNPTGFNADSIADIAKKGGAQYITVTTRHHDGFSMFNSKYTDYDIIDRTPFKRDVIAELVKACRAKGLKIFFYYSLLDWHHPEYNTPTYNKNPWTGRKPTGDFAKYNLFMKNQLTELLTNYGKIDGFWFDGWWDYKTGPWELADLYAHIHKLQPQTLILNNHHGSIIPGEDIQGFEKDLPGQNSHGWNEEDAKVAQNMPMETCETMNESWGFNIKDDKYKTSKALVRYWVKAASGNANFLLNVGPMANGRVQQEFIDTLAKIGAWKSKYGESVFGTQKGNSFSWGVTTQIPGKIYIHVHADNETKIVLDLAEGQKAKTAFDLVGKKNVAFQKLKTEKGNETIVLFLPEPVAGEPERIIRLEY